MIEGFDKEIDAILRKARDSEFAFAAENPQSQILNSKSHLDADEISAFAENALPEKSKVLYTKHLADCDRCRRILSNIILLNAEDETVPVFVAAEEKSFVANIPWYRRLFAFPGLAYSLGALVLVFGGLIGFIALQSSYNSDISKITEQVFDSKNSPASNATNNSAARSNATMPTNSMTANTAANSNTASIYSTNSATNSTANIAVSNSTVNKPQLSSKERAQEAPTTQNEVALGQVQATPTPEDAEKSKDESGSVVTRRLPNPVKKVERDDENKTDNNADSAVGETQKPKMSSPNSGATSTETMNVSGKTFNRRNNVWIDSQYRGQSTTNITRGTEDYKKLDSDLRQTVERLGGTVVIIWKSRAYKIQ